MPNVSAAPVGHWALDSLLKFQQTLFLSTNQSHRDSKQRPKNLITGSPIKRNAKSSKCITSYLQRVRYGEAHQAGAKAVPGDHRKQRGKEDNAVAHTLQPHGQPPA